MCADPSGQDDAFTQLRWNQFPVEWAARSAITVFTESVKQNTLIAVYIEVCKRITVFNTHGPDYGQGYTGKHLPVSIPMYLNCRKTGFPRNRIDAVSRFIDKYADFCCKDR